MQNLKLKAMQSDLPDYGKLQIHITSARGAEPIPGAKVEISYTGEPQRIMEELTTNSSGQTDEVELAVQICGKIKGRVTVAADAPEPEVLAAAREAVAAALEGKTVKKEVYVPGRLVNSVAV